MNNKLTPEQQTLCDDLDKVIDILDGSPAPADARPAAEPATLAPALNWLREQLATAEQRIAALEHERDIVMKTCGDVVSLCADDTTPSLALGHILEAFDTEEAMNEQNLVRAEQAEARLADMTAECDKICKSTLLPGWELTRQIALLEGDIDFWRDRLARLLNGLESLQEKWTEYASHADGMFPGESDRGHCESAGECAAEVRALIAAAQQEQP